MKGILLASLVTVATAVPTPPPSLAPVAPQTVPTPPPALTLQKDAPATELPFWKTKPDVAKRLRETRDVVVSVRNEDVTVDGKKLVRFTIKGAGTVSRNKDVAFRIAQQYEKLKEVSSHFKTVSYDAEKKELFVICEALGWQARMIMKMTPVSEDWRSEIQWQVIWGHFLGMKGTMGFEKVDDTHTEVSILTNYESEKLPLPRVLMGFAFEVIAQKVAEAMRTHLETMQDPVIPTSK
jgi:uncharacterized membrane protein